MRELRGGKVLAGFAGAVADAFTLFEKLEEKLERYRNLTRAAVELAKDWRTDRYLRRLEALLVVADKDHVFMVTGTGDVIEPDDGVARHRLGRPLRARRRARPACAHSTLDAARDRARGPQDRRRDLHLHEPADHVLTEELSPEQPPGRPSGTSPTGRGRSPLADELTPREIVAELDRYIVGQNDGQARRGHRAAQPLAPPAACAETCATRSCPRTSS